MAATPAQASTADQLDAPALSHSAEAAPPATPPRHSRA